MTRTTAIDALINTYPGRFSAELGIGLGGGKPAEIFQWFFASVLFGARISERIVKKTFSAFAERNILSPRALHDTGWDGLVEILDLGGYVRYDFKTATKLLELAKNLAEFYQGDLGRLHAAAKDPTDLEQKLKALAKGIGDITVNIFLREMRGIWEKADPLPSDLVLLAAQDRGIISRTVQNRRKALALLQQAWKAAGRKQRDFPDFEAALVRRGIELRRRRKRRAPVSGSAAA